MEQLDFHEDILVEVLCRLPKKSLARFKSVSKRWCSLISDRKRVFPKTSQAGLICQSYLPLEFRPKASKHSKHPSRINFLHVDNMGSACLARSNLISSAEKNCLISSAEKNCLLISSCNGFLLFRTERRRLRRSGNVHFVVFHPATNRSWNLSPPIHPAGMLVGLVSEGNHFKLLIFLAYADRCRYTSSQTHARYTSHVYSSENEEWRDESWRSPYTTIPRCIIKTIDSGKSVFLKGAFHWIWRSHLVIYRLGHDDCRLLKLPPFPSNRLWRERQNQCIWDSEGNVNYCQVSRNGDRIGIWTLLHNGDGNDERHEYSYKWKVKHKGILAPPIAEIEHPISFSPLGFNDDFEIVYLMCGRSICSYNLATKETKEACASPFEGSDDRALCIALPVLDLGQLEIVDDKMIKKGKPL